MADYFTIKGVPPSTVLDAWRGNDTENSLSHPIPPDSSAFYEGKLAHDLSKPDIHSTLGNLFGALSMGTTSTILVRVSDAGEVTAWTIPA